MPGAVARTSTFALTNATLPYLLVIARGGVRALLDLGPEAAEGLNIHRGKVYHRGVAEAFQLGVADLVEAGV
jgi:alanine dehydrogenase